MGGIATLHPAGWQQPLRDLLLVGRMRGEGRRDQCAQDDHGQQQESDDHQEVAAAEARRSPAGELAHQRRLHRFRAHEKRILGSSQPYSRSTRKLSAMNMPEARTTAACTTGKSRSWIAVTVNRPMPGHPKIVSVITAPPSMY